MMMIMITSFPAYLILKEKREPENEVTPVNSNSENYGWQGREKDT